MRKYIITSKNIKSHTKYQKTYGPFQISFKYRKSHTKESKCIQKDENTFTKLHLVKHIK